MKWIGVWLLSFLVWLVIAVCELNYRVDRGETRSSAMDEAVNTSKAGWLITGLIMLGIWCLTR